MKLSSVEALALALESAGVRYLVVGGLAVAAHGHIRFTKDVDLVIELVTDNIARAFSALASLGYRPNVPVTQAQFNDSATREVWARDKGMTVLQFWSDAHKETSVDVFVTEPFDFAREFDRGVVRPFSGQTSVRFVALDTLLRMKLEAGRAQDLADVEQLRKGS